MPKERFNYIVYQVNKTADTHLKVILVGSFSSSKRSKAALQETISRLTGTPANPAGPTRTPTSWNLDEDGKSTSLKILRVPQDVVVATHLS